jgi:hypothetical protein
MEAVVDGGGGDGVFAAAIDTNDWMVAAASTDAAKLTKMTAITAAAISQKCHRQGCNCIIVPPSHHCLC